MQQTIEYKDVLSLGFERTDLQDSVFFDKYGFNYYLMTLKLYKGISAEWDINERTVRIIRCNKDGDILGQLYVKDLAELEIYIDFFKNK